MVHRLRAGTGLRPGMTPGSLADGRGIRAILAGSGLAGLLGATAYAVASVSAWLAPAYLLLVVVILTAPRGLRVPSQATGTTSELREPLAESGGPLPPHPVPRPSGARAIAWLLRAGLTIGRRRPASPSPHQGEGARRAGEGSGSPAITGQPETPLEAVNDPVVSAAGSDDAEPRTLRVDPAATAIPKPRKSRARSRKAAKPAAEPAPDSAPVTWIRVGPGKFVRSDTMNQGQPPVEAPAPAEVPPPVEAQPPAEAPPPVEEPSLDEAPPPVEEPSLDEAPPPVEEASLAEVPAAVEAPAPTEAPPPAEAQAPAEVQAAAWSDDPVTDRPEPATAEPAVLVEVNSAAEAFEADAPTPEEPATVAQPETDAPVVPDLPTSGGEATEAHPTADSPDTEPTASEDVLESGPAAEEYGIAPSAFGPTAPGPLTSDSPEAEVLDAPEPIVLEPEPGHIPDLDATATGSGPAVARPSRRRRGARTLARLVPRSLVPRSPAREARATPSRREVRGPGRPRAVVRGSATRDPRRESAARRAFGRTKHVRRDWRARSPPDPSSGGPRPPSPAHRTR